MPFHIGALLLATMSMAAPAAQAASMQSNLALLDAARDGKTAIVQSLLDDGAAVNVRNRFGNTPLLYAARMGHLETVKLLIDRGAEINKPNLNNISPLTEAAYHGHVDIVQVLLDGGAATEVVDNSGKTALVYAAGTGNVSLQARPHSSLRVRLFGSKPSDLPTSSSSWNSPLRTPP